MTGDNISSLNGKTQRLQRVAPVEDKAVGAVSGAADQHELVAVRRALAELRQQVAELDAQVAAIRHQAAKEQAGGLSAASVSRMATSIATTILVSTIVRRLRLGVLGAAAAPLLAAQLNHRLWLVR
jgi:Tfp pilus assembly protein FimV